MNRVQIANIKFYGMHALMKENVALSRSAQKTMRIIDAREAERKDSEEKLQHEHDFSDKEP